ncbi:ABC-2 type transport system ATP-binding protein [Marivirga sericea]|uniref:ABC-2 type transport system ATP-binding protein n=1 Tax=Marivirga sericea TaxID=1028 RepID=A0A1X7K4Q4_9BACT|nr:ATP-binding cassette domain-containing protein [Marivirga sericea]SMG35311.1 ABC-2 type transport system ATP-binding protein [Marivirga sericea]
MIKVSNLSKSYGSNEVLNDINIELSSGKIFGFVGENGSGKTTLFKCIAGLEDYIGTIDSDYKPLKNHLGLLLTEPYFLPKLTAREYIILMCDARGKKHNDIDKKNIFELPLDKYAAEYSTGMKKKLAIFAILLQGNSYFILDEPYNGVDIQSNIMISELIKNLKNLGKTVLVSSHIISGLTDLCDKIFLLNDGQIRKDFSRDNFHLINKEMLKDNFTSKINLLDLE